MSSVILYGPPGSGKTTMACSMCKLNLKVLLYDADQKAQRMENLKGYFEKGLIELITPQERLVSDDLRRRITMPKMAPAKQPKGYLEFVDFITALQGGAEYHQDVLVIDSMSRIFEHMKRLILHVQGRGAMEIQDWGILLSNLEELFSTVFNLPFKHVILIAHDQTEKDEVTGRTEVKPLIDGQMKNKLGSYVEEMYYLSVEATKAGAEYKIQTRPVGRITQVRTSRALGTYEPADFSLIFKEG
jgi:hypothetical protein